MSKRTNRKKLAILQSNYIPWKGYFDLINSVDEFIIYDDMQYTKNDWRNRNKIKVKQGTQWLTIPVRQETLEQTIANTRVASDIWRIKHWKSISQAYSRSRSFKESAASLEPLYMSNEEVMLSQINYAFIVAVNDLLGITTKVSWASRYELMGSRTERLVNLCKQTGSQIYVTGPAALRYLDSTLFAREQVEVLAANYSGYPEYEQLYPPFEHTVSIIDLLFSRGSGSRAFMKTFPESVQSEPFLVSAY